MKNEMDATISLRARYDGTTLLLRHCRSLGTAENRVPVSERLSLALGPELARRLVDSLVAHNRR